jgi:hypothetical protein
MATLLQRGDLKDPEQIVVASASSIAQGRCGAFGRKQRDDHIM